MESNFLRIMETIILQTIIILGCYLNDQLKTDQNLQIGKKVSSTDTTRNAK